jgi:16S rRNA (cytidine1402-2'-O)-methyltransferase
MKPLAPGLYLVATPIGNLGDMTKRAMDTLAQAALVACEDTRVTGKLLTLLGIKASLTPYHEHNADRAGPAILARLREGAAVALVSDAGTPLLSDPGYRLVQACIAEDLPVTSVPGASALLPALQLSGLPADRFVFLGFLPNKTAARRRVLGEVMAVPATLVFYESPQRLADSLADMSDVLGVRDAAVSRELTKLHEETRRGTLADLAAHYAEAGAPKGEAVIVVGPPGEAAPPDAQSVDAMLVEALATQSVGDSAAQVAAATGIARRELYTRALALKDKSR